MKTIKRKLIGSGISAIFGGFPSDLVIGSTYELKYDFESQQYVFSAGGVVYKASSFEWNKKY